jgi:hypothetical protein
MTPSKQWSGYEHPGQSANSHQPQALAGMQQDALVCSTPSSNSVQLVQATVAKAS